MEKYKNLVLSGLGEGEEIFFSNCVGEYFVNGIAKIEQNESAEEYLPMGKILKNEFRVEIFDSEGKCFKTSTIFTDSSMEQQMNVNIKKVSKGSFVLTLENNYGRNYFLERSGWLLEEKKFKYSHGK